MSRLKDDPLLRLVLLIALICCLPLIDAVGFSLKLMPVEPLRVFDKTERRDEMSGPLRDSRVYSSSRSHSVPIGGGIGTLGTYYTVLMVAGQPFRVIVVRFFLLQLLFILNSSCNFANH